MRAGVWLMRQWLTSDTSPTRSRETLGCRYPRTKAWPFVNGLIGHESIGDGDAHKTWWPFMSMIDYLYIHVDVWNLLDRSSRMKRVHLIVEVI